MAGNKKYSGDGGNSSVNVRFHLPQLAEIYTPRLMDVVAECLL
jgi:hypothetical protein